MLTSILFWSLISYGSGTTELFQNPDFEGSSFHGNWVCRGSCILRRSNDHFHGRHSGEISNRTHNWSGIKQTVTVTGNQTYVMNGYIKLLNLSPGHMYHKVSVKALYTLGGHTHTLIISIMNMLQKDFGWVEIGGDFNVPSGVHSIDIYLDIPETDVNYLVDNMSLQQLPNNPNWKTEAEQRIQSMRMGSLTVRLNNSVLLDTSNMEIEIQQLKHDFVFGASVGADMMTDPTYQKYQHFIYNNFEWAVIANALKWVATEKRQGHTDYNRPVRAIDALKTRGLTVRGHNMFWDIEKHSPSWLHGLSKNQLITAMHTRINDTVSLTKGKLAHWDVNNENLHGDFFEQKLHNPNVTADMFQWIHQIEPGVKLFLNDYQAYKAQAKTLKASKVPVYGMGLQSHFKSTDINGNVVKYRLDKLAEAGLPLLITELSIIGTDYNRKAEALDDVLTLYFSHPSVEGILIWGWCDQQTFDHRAALVNGVNVTPNAAGARYLQLVKQRWRTHVTQPLRHGIHIKGYHGQYVFNIKKHGHVIESQHFHLGAGGRLLTVHLKGTDHQTISSSIFG